MDALLERLTDVETIMTFVLPVLWRVIAALLTFVIGRWAAKLIVRVVRKVISRKESDPMIVNFVGNVLYGISLAIVVIAALGNLGIDTTSAAAVLGGMAVAVGLALQGQLSSFASGVLLIMFRPFRAGDFVQIGGTMGVVEHLKIVVTVLKSPDGQELTLPNSSVWGNTITNFSIRPIRRVDLAIGISYNSDLLKAKNLLLELLANEPRFLEDPAKTVHCTNLGESSVDFAVRGWTNSGDWWNTRCDMIEKIKLRFDAEGIEIPFPQMDLHVRDMPEPPEDMPSRAA